MDFEDMFLKLLMWILLAIQALLYFLLQLHKQTSETNSSQPEVVTGAEIPVEPEETALPTGVALSEGDSF